jgi:hypothetical protein
MKNKSFLMVTILLLHGILNAQIDFRPGYIIKQNGDTVFGEIDYRSELLRGQSCHFRFQDKAGTRDFFPNDLLSYRFIDGKYYISREVDGKKVFLEFLIQAKISIYYLRDTRGEHYYLEKEGFEFAELPYEDKRVYDNGAAYSTQSRTHIAMLNLYMQDAPSMQEQITAIGKPTHQNLIRLVKYYHQIVSKGLPFIVFEKKPSRSE